MVIAGRLFALGTLLIGAQDVAHPMLERLDPRRRVAVVMALLGLTLIGLFLITFAMVGGHWVRRLACYRPGRRRARNEATTDRELEEALGVIPPDIKSADTILLDMKSRDTKVEP